MTRETFLLLNSVVVMILVVFIFRARRRKMPTQLDLRAREARGFVNDKALQKVPGEPNSVSVATVRPVEKSLNVIFMYNGEPWDAFEALGLPAGSSVEAAKRALESQKLKVSGVQGQFFQAAYDAIARSQR